MFTSATNGTSSSCGTAQAGQVGRQLLGFLVVGHGAGQQETEHVFEEQLQAEQGQHDRQGRDHQFPLEHAPSPRVLRS